MVHHIFMTIFAVVPLALGGRSDGGTGYDLLKVTSEARKDIAWKKATFLAAAKGDADTIAALAAPEAEDQARPDRFPATTRARQSRQAKLAADRDDQNKMSPAHEDISKLGEDIPKPGAVGAIRKWVDWLFSSAPDELLFSGNADPATAAALGVTTGKVSASGSSPPDLSKPGPAAALWGWADRLIPSVPGVWLVSGARDHTPAEPLDAGTRKVSAHRPSTPETTQGEAAALVEEKAIYDKETPQGEAAALVEDKAIHAKATTPPFSSGDSVAQWLRPTPESNGFADPKWQAITPRFSTGDRVEAAQPIPEAPAPAPGGFLADALQTALNASTKSQAARKARQPVKVIRAKGGKKRRRDFKPAYVTGNGKKQKSAAEKRAEQARQEAADLRAEVGREQQEEEAAEEKAAEERVEKRKRAEEAGRQLRQKEGYITAGNGTEGLFEPRCNGKYPEADDERLSTTLSNCKVAFYWEHTVNVHFYEELCKVTFNDTSYGKDAWEDLVGHPNNDGFHRFKYTLDSPDADTQDCMPVVEEAARS